MHVAGAQHLVVGHAHGQGLYGRADLLEDHVQRLRQHAWVRPGALHSPSTPPCCIAFLKMASTAACMHLQQPLSVSTFRACSKWGMHASMVCVLPEADTP
jgi:hypothetical protein